LIKDALNGFFIILEDQYAVGDIISVGQVSGLVEQLNLRITQLRDAEGRLITIPNSEIKIVANLSSNWSRADLKIAIDYQMNIDRALAIITQVAEDISKEENWREKIWESPQVLGVEEFSDRGVVIRVWIKTEPLKQWEVAREFRRRIKKAFKQAGMPLPLPQQQVWINPSQK
jgi:small conductance mechanosensitive channel